MQRGDLGEIVGGHTYERIIDRTDELEWAVPYLASTDDLFSKLSSAHSHLGIALPGIDTINVKIKLPDSPIIYFRDNWCMTTMKRVDGYHLEETVLATPGWLSRFYAENGDPVIISKIINIPRSLFDFRPLR